MTLAALSAHTLAAALPLFAIWPELGPSARAALASVGRDELGLALAVLAVIGLAAGLRRDVSRSLTDRSNRFRAQTRGTASLDVGAPKSHAPDTVGEVGSGATSAFVEARLAALRAKCDETASLRDPAPQSKIGDVWLGLGLAGAAGFAAIVHAERLQSLTNAIFLLVREFLEKILATF
ncbi:MAG: hypothetical protein ACFB2Z_11045 [Maricaulaceae bacterium]